MTDLARLQTLLAQHFPDATVRQVGEAARDLARQMKVTP